MRIIYFKKDEKHVLGRAGENGATRITVDVAAWAAEYPSGTGALLYKRPDGLVYPLTATLDGGLLCAVLTATDTAVSGVARVEAQWIEGAVVVKSATYEGSIASSLGEAGSVPAASPSWVDDMAALGVTVEADAAQVAADKATVAADKEAAAASEASIDSMVDTIAKQTIAEQMLAVLQQEAAYLQTIAENGGTGGNLNGFSLNLENDAVVLSYTNPTDGTDTRSATFPTKTTGDLIVAELAAINATLRTMVPNTNA